MGDVRVALVSGGTRGIGRAITERLLADGWSVLATFVHDTDSAAALQAQHPGLCVLRSDSSSASDCLTAVEECGRQFGQLDHVVSVAGITRDVALGELNDADWDAVLATNLSGPFRLARAAMPWITASPRGRIVVISSVAALMGNAQQGAYAASKAGLVGLTKTLARELARTGTTVNLVIPGPTADTGITAATDPAFVAAIARKIPLHRLGRPEEIAHAVRFLLDDLSAFTTGTAIVVDGGLSM
ncbi:MAG: SDR family NAD(P)-dependent oxidoreductase [Actinomycetota bacterium]|nr:SDR family NAD(P)-dependent oxidoreductase [Actinomycetota bacterium]